MKSLLTILIIGIGELREYIDAAFENDMELIDLYDKNVEVDNLEDICENMYDKISSLIEPAEYRGISVGGLKIGYFVYVTGNLISFGMNKIYRDKEHLNEFWRLIKSELGEPFQCSLFGYNRRAIAWLKKCGMKIIFENVTILQLCH